MNAMGIAASRPAGSWPPPTGKRLNGGSRRNCRYHCKGKRCDLPFVLGPEGLPPRCHGGRLRRPRNRIQETVYPHTLLFTELDGAAADFVVDGTAVRMILQHGPQYFKAIIIKANGLFLPPTPVPQQVQKGRGILPFQ